MWSGNHGHTYRSPRLAPTDFETKRHHLKNWNRFGMQFRHMLRFLIVCRFQWTVIVRVWIPVLHKSNLLYQARVDLNIVSIAIMITRGATVLNNFRKPFCWTSYKVTAEKQRFWSLQFHGLEFKFKYFRFSKGEKDRIPRLFSWLWL